MHDDAALLDPGVVKVVRAADGQVLYCSRSAVPYLRDTIGGWAAQARYWGHVGLYGYDRSFLEGFAQLPESALEDAERLEQLRWLEAGVRLRSFEVPPQGPSVDTLADLERVRETLMAGDPVSAPPLTVPAPREAARASIAAARDALRRLAEGLGPDFDRAAERLISLDGKVITLGVGKSGLVAAKIAATLRSISLPAVNLNVSDVLHGDLGAVAPGDVAIVLSKSGTTAELVALVPHLRARSATLIAIVGSAGSPLARASDVALLAAVEREGCPLDCAPMASALAAQATGDALAAAVSCGRGLRAEDFAALHPAGALGVRLTLRVADVMRRGDELARVRPDATLRDAVIEITRTGYGAVCVVGEDERLHGFLTDGDIRRCLLEVDSLEAPVATLMTRAPLTVSPDVLLSEALLELERRTKAFLTAPVVDRDARCVGLLRLHDAVRAHLPS